MDIHLTNVLHIILNFYFMLEKVRSRNIENSYTHKKERVKHFKEGVIETGVKTQTVISTAEGRDGLKQNQYKVETITSDSPELTPELLEEISDFFRYTFNNAFPEYAVCTDCDVSISAPEVFGTEGRYVSLDQLDNEGNLPCCPECDKQMKFFHDAGQVLKKLEQKFQKDGRITLLKVAETNEIEGMTFGYYDSLEGVVEKEWGHPYNYMKKEYQKKEQKFDAEGATKKILETNKALEEQTEICCWNCIMLNPEAQGNMNILVQDFLDSLTKTDIAVVAQVIAGSISHSLLKRRGYNEVEGIFPKEYLLMMGNLELVRNHYLK